MASRNASGTVPRSSPTTRNFPRTLSRARIRIRSIQRSFTYVNERWIDLMRILALESVRGKFLVVGEDLGTVPDALREAMDRFGILSYRLFYFEKGSDGEP